MRCCCYPLSECTLYWNIMPFEYTHLFIAWGSICNVSWIIIIGLCRFTSSHPSCDVFKRVFDMIHSFISAHSTSSSLFNCLTKLESILLYCFHIKPRRVNRREVKLSLKHQINKVEDEEKKDENTEWKSSWKH